MDIGQTPAKEHILAITDRFTGYVWAAKTGDSETGTAGKCIDILKSCIGTGLLATGKKMGRLISINCQRNDGVPQPKRNRD